MSRASKITGVLAAVAASALMSSASAFATSCPNPDVQVTGLTPDQMESSIGCLINEERTSRGLAAVQPNSQLRQAALSHSTEMVNQGYFEHTSPSGVTFIDRIQGTGYMRKARFWEVGENLVWGSGPLSTPQALVTAWMNSPPHRENLLRKTFREIGIAAVVGTPESRLDATGVTVSSEYGYRVMPKKKKRHLSKAKARRARAHKHNKRHHKHRHAKRYRAHV